MSAAPATPEDEAPPRPLTRTGASGAAAAGGTVISVDAMGGDRGPAAVIAGVVRAASANPDVRFLLFGPEEELRRLTRRRGLPAQVALRNAEGVITMDTKPSHAMRHGKGSSMWAAIDAVKDGEARACVSCGNTGALMAVAMLRLRKLAGVHRPAIACLWPSRNPGGFNVMLDVGADISADARDLAQYALMGVSYARNGLGLARPRVGLLNVGTEEHKGHAELKVAQELVAANAEVAHYDYVGFVEGRDLSSTRVDVIVTDGFTGNIALKTGEGTATLIAELLRDAFKATPLSRIAALLAMTSLGRLSRRIDPRRVNGGVFLGLNGTVVKSHGGADATGVAAAIDLAIRLDRSGFQERLAARVASGVTAPAGEEGPEADLGDAPTEAPGDSAGEAPRGAGGAIGAQVRSEPLS